MANRFSPTVLPDYYGGNPGQEIASALQTQADRQQQNRNSAALYGPKVLPPKRGILGDPYAAFRDDASGGAAPAAAGSAPPSGAGTAPDSGGTAASNSAPAASPAEFSQLKTAVAQQQQQPSSNADPFQGNRTQQQAGAQGFMPATDSGAYGRSNVSASGSDVPAAAQLHSNRPGEFDGRAGFIGHPPVTEGWEQHAPAPAQVATASGGAGAPAAGGAPAGGAAAMPATASPAMAGGAGGAAGAAPAPPQSELSQIFARYPKVMTPAERGSLASMLDVQKTANDTRRAANEETGTRGKLYAEGITPDQNGDLHFDPTNPTVQNALASQAPALALKGQEMALENKRVDLMQQLGVARNDIERAGVTERIKAINLEMDRFHETVGREMANTFEKQNDKLYGVGDLYRDWQTKLDQARQGNPADMKAATASFQRLVDQSSGGRLGMLKYLQNINPSLAGQAEQTLNRLSRGQYGKSDLDNMAAVSDATAKSASDELDRRRAMEVANHPEVPGYSRFLRPTTFQTSPGGGAPAAAKRPVSQAEFNALSKAHPGQDLSQYYQVQP